MKQNSHFILVAALAFLQACGNPVADPAKRSPEAQPQVVESAGLTTEIYLNGDIVTMDEAQPLVEAVAVRDGTILAVGDRVDVEALAGDNVKILDLQGNTLLPGLIDAHGHLGFTALNMAAANVSSPPVGIAVTVADVVELLKQQRDKSPAGSWISGWGYDDSLLAEQRHPTRAELDQVSSDRPVAILHVSGHFVSCNSACLALAGINAESEAPPGGIIRRMAGSNQPDGVLEETAIGAVMKVLPRPDKATRLALLKQAQDYYARNGITTVQDGAVQADEIALMRDAAQQDLLYLDIVAYPYAAYLGDQLSQFPPSHSYDGHFRVGGFKLVLDGSPQGKTAWLTKPYLHPPHGQPADYVGYPTLSDEQVNDYVDFAFANNIPVLAHANGDAAADQLINAVKAGNSAHGNADRRTVMIHAQTVRDDQIDSMLEQGIMPSYFSVHTFYWGDWHRDSVFGVERASRISPLRTSTDKGLRYSTHNDTPIVPPDMMRLVWSSVNRITRSGKVLGEEQRATPMEALKSITLDAAYQYFEEDTKGSISVGKVADFVVLGDNPLKVDKLAIKDIEVLQTIKDGVVVFSK